MLKELSALRAASIVNVQENFDALLQLTTETEVKLFEEFKKYNPESTVELIGSIIKFNNSKNRKKAQTAYLPFQWFLRIHQCREFIEALNEYVPHLDLLKKSVGDRDIFKTLPMIEWQDNLDKSTSQEINNFINVHFDNPSEKGLFRAFLDGRSWLDEKNSNNVPSLAGRKFDRRNTEYIGSAIASVTRLINDSSGALPFFIDLYISSKEVRNIISQQNVFVSFDDIECLGGSENIIYYGAPGTGKSHTIDKVIDEANTVRTVFHSDTQNSDFMGCLKPVTDGVTIKYEFRPGPFTIAVINAANNPANHYWLVIEEINRAPAAAVFGEIFQLLDRDSKSGESRYSITLSDLEMQNYISRKAVTAIEGGKLKIPGNLSLLATMNSSDQAVMPLDTAFKRRWKFRYIPLDFDVAFNNIGSPCAKGDLIITDQSDVEATISWRDFATAINKILTANGIPEDRHLGPFFLSDNELSKAGRREALTGKLVMYLWDDVLRHGMTGAVFKSDIRTYGQLTRLYDDNNQVFNGDFYELVEGKLQTVDVYSEDTLLARVAEEEPDYVPKE